MTVTSPAFTQRLSAQPAPLFKQLEESSPDRAGRRGPVDQASIDEIVQQFPMLPVWADGGRKAQRDRLLGARKILEWLRTHRGEGWQERWLVSGADDDLDWIDTLVADDPRAASSKRTEIMRGLSFLLLCRVVLPSYAFLASYNACKLFSFVQRTLRPDQFATMQRHAGTLGIARRRVDAGLGVVAKLVLHTGRSVDQLTPSDLFAYHAWETRQYGQARSGVFLAWVLLGQVTSLGGHASLQDALRLGQRPTSELVDAHRIRCRPVRDVLVRYLDERRPAMDYGSFGNLITTLVGNFWADLEHHHPGIATLHLLEDIATAWKQRLRTITCRDGSTRPRKSYLAVLVQVRAFYLDIQQWAVTDTSWAPWSVPSPVRKADTLGMAKARKHTTAQMHQRVRDRLPHLPVLVDTAERHLADQAALLAAARAVDLGVTFEHAGQTLRRTMPPSHAVERNRAPVPRVLVDDLTTGEQIDLTHREDEAFWAWAVIEGLRHIGVRVEELTEITHLALVSYQLPDTGEIVPMLQIVPSKSNEERLLLVSPELASVLATIITRLRTRNAGSVPATARYDPYERITGPALPYLFQRRRGWYWKVISQSTIQTLLTQTLARTGLRDAAGEPLHYTPHDFRRMFATEAVTGGLPVHIVARLLGHANINTTQAYMAVFDEELVRAYRQFLTNRRATRPDTEYREPTDEEWQEFQQHFQTRKLELGECGRPYGTPCKHEHACIRCPSLRLDPLARPRLFEIIANLKERIQEARMNGWLGEVQGLQVSLDAATKKFVSLDRMRDRQPGGPINLGMPIITDPH